MPDSDRAQPTGTTQVSVLRPYSTGVVVDHQKPGAYNIKVHLLEVSSMLTGDLAGSEDVLTADGTTPDGEEYSDQKIGRAHV